MLFGVPDEIPDVRGVPEWSGGKDLYMGSPVSGIGTSFGVIGCIPKCLGTTTRYLGQSGKPTRFLESAKGSFVESRGQTLGSLASGSRRWEPWRLALESEKDSCLSGKTDFEEAFTPSFDSRAQQINRGAGLAPKKHQETPSRVPATLSPLVSPPS